MDITDRLAAMENEIFQLKQEYYPLLIEIRAFIMEANNPVNMYADLLEAEDTTEEAESNTSQTSQTAKLPDNDLDKEAVKNEYRG